MLDRHPEYRHAKILERIIEPERVILFRVPWVDDQGKVRVNRGFRIEMNSAIGPYKGGLRFHPSVNLGILKFLAFEQVFKNSLTTLPMGGGKGGSDFDPKGKSDNEVMRFCQAFMARAVPPHRARHRRARPATSASAAARSATCSGMYKKLRNEFTGVLTGKGLNWGGSLIRPEATGYGCVYFAQEMLGDPQADAPGQDLPRLRQRQRLAVHGREDPRPRRQGRHALRLERLRLRRGRDRPREARRSSMDLKNVTPRAHQGVRRQVQERRLHADRPQARLQPALEPQGRLRVPERDAERDQRQGRGEPAARTASTWSARAPTCRARSTRSTSFLDAKILYGPGKAANAGGVATSGLEMSQNSMRLSWSREEVDQRLHGIMKSIHKACFETAERFGTPGNYVNGANIAGFLKVANAMMDQGVV